MTEVNIPGVGGVDKRVAIAIGVGTVGAIGLIWWRRRNAPPAADPGTDPAAYDETSLLDTGEYGGGAAWQYAASPTGGVSGYTGADGVPRTNAEWAQQAIDALEAAGYDRNAAAAALGAYLGHQLLTAAQAIMIRSALALAGSPPEGAVPVSVAPVVTPKPTPTPTPKPTPSKPAPKPTPSKPAPKPAANPVTRTLKVGSRGNDVKILQRKLGVTADGIFGPKTLAAVKAYQKRMKLVVDGIVGPKTQAKLGI